MSNSNMKWFSFLVIILGFTSRKSLAGLVVGSSSKKYGESSNVRNAIKLCKTCYKTGVQTVGLAGSSAEILPRLWSDEPQAVIFIDDPPRPTTTPGPGTRETRYKLQNFVITASSIRRLERTLLDLKASPWWNHMASFLIIDESLPLDQGCSNAFKILSITWKMNILHAKVVSHHESKGPLIYSYNPYTIQAPLPWELVKTYRVDTKHPWTLLVQGYEDNQEICKTLDFDKTKDLGGYETRLSSYSVTRLKNWSDTNLKSTSSPHAIPLHYIFRKLNSAVKIFVESPKSIYNLTTSGFIDISLNAWYQQNNFNTSMTYPHGSSGLVSITQHRGHLSQIGKLLHVLDKSSRIAVVIVGLVTFVFFKFFIQQSVTSASLNIVRLICNTAVPNLPNNVAMRIYLSGLFAFCVTLQGIYQGQLASLLTKQVNLRNVETLEDLENFNYTIYGHKDMTSYLEILNFSGRIVALDDFFCEKFVLDDAGAACVRGRSLLVDIAKKHNLHISRNYLLEMYLVYLIREDWPIEEQLNTLISRLVEADIFYQVLFKKVDLTVRRMKHDQKEKNKQKFEVITLKELAFAFAILGIGLACSSLIFIIEILIR